MGRSTFRQLESSPSCASSEGGESSRAADELTPIVFVSNVSTIHTLALCELHTRAQIGVPDGNPKT